MLVVLQLDPELALWLSGCLCQTVNASAALREGVKIPDSEVPGVIIGCGSSRADGIQGAVDGAKPVHYHGDHPGTSTKILSSFEDTHGPRLARQFRALTQRIVMVPGKQRPVRRVLDLCHVGRQPAHSRRYHHGSTNQEADDAMPMTKMNLMACG